MVRITVREGKTLQELNLLFSVTLLIAGTVLLWAVNCNQCHSFPVFSSGNVYNTPSKQPRYFLLNLKCFYQQDFDTPRRNIFRVEKHLNLWPGLGFDGISYCSATCVFFCSVRVCMWVESVYKDVTQLTWRWCGTYTRRNALRSELVCPSIAMHTSYTTVFSVS